VALVGSWARAEAQPDSDVDQFVQADAPGVYVDTEDWAAALGAVGPLTTRRWGAISERRLRLAALRERCRRDDDA
jgi:hypothetical protein